LDDKGTRYNAARGMNQSYIAKPSLLLLREHCVQLFSCAAMIEVNFFQKKKITLVKGGTRPSEENPPKPDIVLY